ncbi:hypothetical protein [Pseudomonas mohnii]|uniref:hypothetical protein n=1 Tax=Pseudomonas mohnii TaxID=395600 RepID=UPI0018DB9181|nr:hypothetical protein [Pseudomonas mohnii]MBH8612552.1 hypothetical protein [Pseudomonas mohnii]
MKFLKVLVMSVAFTASLIGTQRLMATDAFPDGLIRFSEKEDGSGVQCSVPVRTGDYLFNTEGAYDCPNDKMNYFQLDGAPSATYFTLYSDSDEDKRECQEASGVRYGWKYTFFTIKHPTTTRWIKIDELHPRKFGEIVVAGVVLSEKHEETGDRIDELTCVKIKRSALP